MIWRNPVAWFGLATLLIPVLIHLLVRHRAEPRPFPSLRFVQPTRLASVRRKMISDWPLLLMRLAMLAAAVAALADPLWQSAARRAEWNARQARAIVVDTTASVTSADAASIAQREAAAAFKAERFETKQLAEGIGRAADWLRTAPPARRELVIVSDFQLGALDAAMLRDIPSHVGIRFVRTSAAPVTRTADGQPRTQRTAAGGFALRSPRVTLNTSETAVTWTDAASKAPVEIDTLDAPANNSEASVRTTRKFKGRDINLRPLDVKLRGSDADRPFLHAAAEAVLAQGIPVAPGFDGWRYGATLMFAADEADNAGPGEWDAGGLLTQWQVDAARAIATDTSLARAAGRATVASSRAPGMPAPAAKSSVPSSSEATAQSRRASNASSDVPEPWIVLMRDAGGAPAVLAAADGFNGTARMLVWSRMSAADEATALLIRATLRALAGPDAFGEAEVVAMPDATLAQWQRPASEPPASEWREVDGNDRRWLWGAVLVLLVAEQVVRRRARHAEAQADRKVFEHAA
jgi:hypothetical protein